ncbi:DUF3551 domain-containing protein [Rhodopseudomonas palustris]|uniref:DUF3551 domain-containing protein n=1 Tax=Rhodopseudomonas palustris (strain ATCC BAA-98 / CGA009) TaxID=258594 RepID=Q6N0D5_RHOPA|nr:DUF3551 domain-containing protein [Rhodopseudomonas palustris]ACF03801.1 hypothetical protein Rpal_5315 [Rhodopseudomonas palustris TIE-1]OPF95691.1 hypothetical protein B1S06_05905 [Rhodopseudomonas palustris]PPQ43141.1 DUF3551 domain-containing protein [Rhodopseudomonas palustris]QLH73759.1 DUF3551 domain-containing protein [Rhodopseudomonas palustris]QQM06406.1 hypothetical protein I8G32_04993 [Rhodopseudomonas palustris]
MRYLALAAMALGAFGATQLIGAQPAAASVEYPYCIQGKQQGFPGDCNYATFSSCRFTASGQGGSCVMNPRYGTVDRGYDSYGYAPAAAVGGY